MEAMKVQVKDWQAKYNASQDEYRNFEKNHVADKYHGNKTLVAVAKERVAKTTEKVLVMVALIIIIKMATSADATTMKKTNRIGVFAHLIAQVNVVTAAD
jgi:hypothetical protein